MTFHNQELQKTSSLNVFFSWLLVWHPGKKGSLGERVLLSNNNKLPFRLVSVLVYPFNRGKSPNLIRAEVFLNKVCKLLWYLHKKSSHKCFPDVQIIVTTVEVSAATCQVEPVHDSGKLLPHIVSWLEWSMLNKVVITPLYVFMVYVTMKITVTYHNRINTGEVTVNSFYERHLWNLYYVPI